VTEHRIAVIAGDGIGREVVPEGIRVLEAAGAKHGLRFRWDELPWSCEHYARHGRMMPEDALERIRRHDAIFLGAVGFPGVPDHVSLWGLLIPIRRGFQQYANVRPIRLMPGLPTPLAGRKAGDIDMVIVRENTEGEYSEMGGRHNRGHADEMAIQETIFTRAGVDRVMRHAFRLAEKRGKKLTSATKSNGIIHTMPFWDERFAAVGKDYPGVKTDQFHIDILTSHFVRHPDWFDVVVGSNLFGDILSDLGPAVAGGIGIAPSANLDPTRTYPSMFEPVYGSAPDIAGKNIANPTALLLSGFAMLRHLGLTENAAVIENALLYTLEQGVHTGDFGDKNKPSFNTTQFAEAIIGNFGKTPELNAKALIPNKPGTPTPLKLESFTMLESKEIEQEKIIGVDMFIESNEQPDAIAKKCQRHGGVKFNLTNISNRGTQVWPTGSVYTNLVNQYNVRFESIDNYPLNQQDVIGLYVSLSGDFKIASLELLNMWGDKKSYSSAAGQ
jgi:tartrate dehydrogenase